MNHPSPASIAFSAFLLGGVAVLMLTREPSIPMILLGIGVFGQLTAKLVRARQIDHQSELGAPEGTRTNGGNQGPGKGVE